MGLTFFKYRNYHVFKHLCTGPTPLERGVNTLNSPTPIPSPLERGVNTLAYCWRTVTFQNNT